MRRRSTLVAAAAAVGLALVGWAAAPASADVQKPRQVTLFSGPTGGAWYPIAGGLSKVFADAGVRSAAEVGVASPTSPWCRRGAASSASP